MFDVFVCYSHKDITFAQALLRRLKSAGFDAFLNLEAVQPGQPLRQELADAIIAADNILFIASPDSMRSPHCRLELDFAGQYRKRIFPLILDSVDYDNSLEVRHLGLNARSIKITDSLKVEPFDAIFMAIKRDRLWRRQSTEYLMRAERWRVKTGDLLSRPELDAAQKWLVQGVRMDPGPSELQVRFIQQSQADQLRVSERWKDLHQSALARQLAAQAQNLVGAQPDLALLLAAQAHWTRNLPETKCALLQCLDVHRRLWVCLHEHKHPIAGLAFTHDGTRLASIEAFKGRTQTLSQPRFLSWDLDTTLAVAYEAQQNLTAIAWSAATGAIALANGFEILVFHGDSQLRLSGHEGIVKQLVFHPLESLLCSADENSSVIFWNSRTGEPMARLDSDGPISGIHWLDGGACLLYADTSSLRARSYPGLEVILDLQLQDTIRAMDVSPDGRRVAVLTQHDGSEALLFYDRANGQTGVWTFDNPDAQHHDLAISLDGTRLYTAGGRGNVGIDSVVEWSRSDGQKLDTLWAGSNYSMRHITCSANGRFIAAGGDDGKIVLWDLRRESSIPVQVHPADSPVTCVLANPCTQTVAAGHADGTITFHSFDGRATTPGILFVGPSPISQLAFRGDGKRIATVQENGELSLWDSEAVIEIARAPNAHGTHITDLAFNGPGAFLATAGAGGTVVLRLGDNLKFVGVLEDDSPPAGLMAALARAPRAADADPSGGRLNAVKTCLAFNPDQSLLLISSIDNISGWDPKARSATTRLGVGSAGVSSPDIAVSSDGAFLLWGGGFSMYLAPLADLETGVNERRWHYGDVACLAFHPDNRTAVSFGGGELLFWDVTVPEPLGRVRYVDPVVNLSFSSDGRYLAGADVLGRMIIWDADADVWAKLAAQKANRRLSESERERYLSAA